MGLSYVSLEAASYLGVVEGAVTHGSPRSAKGEGAAVKQVPAPVSVLGGLIHNLNHTMH